MWMSVLEEVGCNQLTPAFGAAKTEQHRYKMHLIEEYCIESVGGGTKKGF
jgi:hypothetical protein